VEFLRGPGARAPARGSWSSPPPGRPSGSGAPASWWSSARTLDREEVPRLPSRALASSSMPGAGPPAPTASTRGSAWVLEHRPARELPHRPRRLPPKVFVGGSPPRAAVEEILAPWRRSRRSPEGAGWEGIMQECNQRGTVPVGGRMPVAGGATPAVALLKELLERRSPPACPCPRGRRIRDLHLDDPAASRASRAVFPGGAPGSPPHLGPAEDRVAPALSVSGDEHGLGSPWERWPRGGPRVGPHHQGMVHGVEEERLDRLPLQGVETRLQGLHCSLSGARFMAQLKSIPTREAVGRRISSARCPITTPPPHAGRRGVPHEELQAVQLPKRRSAFDSPIRADRPALRMMRRSS